MYKSCAWAFKNGEKFGYVVVKDYETMTGAIKAAENFKNLEAFDAVAIEVREYPKEAHSLFFVPAGTGADNGREVYRDIESLQDAIEKRFIDLREGEEEFEGTMSYMIDLILGNEFDEERYLHPILEFLRDDEVNPLLKKYGDDEIFIYKDCGLVSTEEKDLD